MAWRGRRVVGRWWRLLRGWWLLAFAAAGTAVLSVIGQAYSGLVAAILVAVGSALAGALTDRGRSQVTGPATASSGSPRGLYVARVSRIDDPIRLGVHPAAALEQNGKGGRVPAFVERDMLPEVESALRAGGFVLVVGDSTAGKTRLAYEAMRACLADHVCVQPELPEALALAVEAAERERPSVLWLDDLERYLGAGGLKRAVVADLVDRQVVVLATMRAHEREGLSARHDPQRPSDDRQSARAGRDVLSGVSREIRLERAWSVRELARAGELTHDRRIAQALNSVGGYGLAEVMAAGPQLLAEWRDAWSAAPRTPVAGQPSADPRGAALVAAAVDVRRAGYHRPVPIAVLRTLHERYLSDRGGASLRPGPWENALAWATQPLHATSSLLAPADEDHYLAFDYLVDALAADQDTHPVPSWTWRTLADVVAPAELVHVAWQASYAGHTDIVPTAFQRALDAGEYLAASELAICLADAGHKEQATQMLATTIDRAADSGLVPEADLLYMRQGLAWEIGAKVNDHGDPHRATELMRQVAAGTAALLGDDHRDTIYARIGLARQLGASGHPGEALQMAQELVERTTARFGAVDEATLSARFEVAVWTLDVDGAEAGAKLFRNLAASGRSLQPVLWDLVVDAEWSLGGALIDAGDPQSAIAVLSQVISQCQKLFGARHLRTLNVRLSYVQAVGHAGPPTEARQLAAQLVEDTGHALGGGHPTSLDARLALAQAMAATGEHTERRRLLEQLHADAARLLGGDHRLAASALTALNQGSATAEQPTADTP